MITDKVFAAKGGPLSGPFDIHLDPFLTRLRVEGYAERTLRKKRAIAASFARWSVGKQISAGDLNELHLTAFVKRRPRRGKDCIKAELATLRLFLKYLRAELGRPITPLRIDASPADRLKQRYMDYLRKERGLTENTIRVYLPFIHNFLSEQVAKTGCASPEALDAITVRDFLIDHFSSRSREYLRLLSTVLRSMFLGRELQRGQQFLPP